MRVSALQYITRDNDKFSHSEQAKLMYTNGIDWVQIRMKNATASEIEAESIKALEYARTFNSKLIINDNIEITKEIGAHGVHLGLKDMPVNDAREYLGNDFIIGGTANTIEDLVLQCERGADYVGLGPFRFTTTKKNLSQVIGLEGYKQIVNQTLERRITIPIVAVGGITPDDIDRIKDTGINGVAISGALFEKYSSAQNIEKYD
jgi:thiamine-phosphate pyrophosphorylase